MKEKIIEIIKETISTNYDLLDKLIKSEIYTDTDYLAESMFNHFK